MIKVGILGAAGYTGGELIRLLLNHPEAEIVFANSESNAGNLVSDVHEGLIGDTDLRFTDQMPFDQVDVVFFCFGHGKSEAFLKEHTIPANVKIIDLAKRMIALSGAKNVEIKFTGLRPGEKLYEELLMSEEGLENTSHDKIFVAAPMEITMDELENKLADFDKLITDECEDLDKIKEVFKKNVPTYKEAR
jgi:hypothetical protein